MVSMPGEELKWESHPTRISFTRWMISTSRHSPMKKSSSSQSLTTSMPKSFSSKKCSCLRSSPPGLAQHRRQTDLCWEVNVLKPPKSFVRFAWKHPRQGTCSETTTAPMSFVGTAWADTWPQRFRIIFRRWSVPRSTAKGCWSQNFVGRLSRPRWSRGGRKLFVSRCCWGLRNFIALSRIARHSWWMMGRREWCSPSARLAGDYFALGVMWHGILVWAASSIGAREPMSGRRRFSCWWRLPIWKNGRGAQAASSSWRRQRVACTLHAGIYASISWSFIF